MICPYCQHELEVESLSCPRCLAAYPRAGAPFGTGVRVTVAAGAMMLVASLILVQCVVAYLPGGSHAVLSAQSKLFTGTQPPDFRSPDLDRTLGQWAAHQQSGGEGRPGFPGSH
jgi:hypothetical protein